MSTDGEHDTEKIDSRIRQAIDLAQATCPVREVLAEMRKENASRHDQQMSAISAVREEQGKQGERIAANRRDIDANTEEGKNSRRTNARNMWGVIAAGIVAILGVVLNMKG